MSLITEKSIHIHVQKTGGMAVRRALHCAKGMKYESGPTQAEMHMGVPELLATHPGIDQGRFMFGFVRHPVSWIRSRWAYAVESGYKVHVEHRPKAAVLWLNAVYDDSLETFVEKYLERYPGAVTQTMFRRLGLWTSKPCDYVGRVESLIKDTVTAMSLAGEVFDEQEVAAIGKYNASKTTEQVPKRLASQIEQVESALMNRFYA